MAKNKRKTMTSILLCMLSLCMLLVFAGCEESNQDNPGNSAQPTPTVDPSKQDDNNTMDAFTTEDGIQFTKFDQTATWEGDAVHITLNNDTATASGDGVAINGGVVTISKPGSYILSGSLTDGQIVVEVTKEEKVQLVLNGVDITCSNSAAIYVKSADKVSLTLVKDTVNKVKDGLSYTFADGEDEPNACIFSKDDLSINGEGTLQVEGNYNNGIATKNDLKIIGGTIQVTALNNGIKGKDSVCIMGGNITVDVDGDGIKSDNEVEAEKGYVYIYNGTINIDAAEDGIQAITAVTLKNGDITIDAGDKQVACKGTKTIDVQIAS